MAVMRTLSIGTLCAMAAVWSLALPSHAQQGAAARTLPGASLAVEKGCLNCHGNPPRGDAPSFRRLQQRAAGREGEQDAIARHWIDEMRASGSGWSAIVGHRQLSDASARALADWLVRPPARPVE